MATIKGEQNGESVKSLPDRVWINPLYLGELGVIRDSPVHEQQCFKNDVAYVRVNAHDALVAELATIDEALARRPRLDSCTNRYHKIFRLCSMAGRMESACIQVRNFLMSKARRDPQERELVQLLTDVLALAEETSPANIRDTQDGQASEKQEQDDEG